jgi:F-type H+-transporting ATPase subunit b
MFGLVSLLLAAEQEAPNPILPATKEIVWGALAFLAVFLVLRAKAYPAIKAGLKQREDRIRADLEAAEQSKMQANGILEQYQRQLSDARNEAGRIIDEARKAADDLRRELMAKAESEAAELRQRAQADIDATVSRAKADLQREVASFAVTIAERVVERSLDRDAQLALIDRYINEVGGMQPPSNN